MTDTPACFIIETILSDKNTLHTDIFKEEHTMDLKGRDFLTLKDFTPEEISYLLDLSAELKDKKKKGIPVDTLRGKNVALIFEKTSTRTRCSFEVAAHDLGMGTTYLDPTGSQIGKKESIKDTARVLAGMYEGIEYRGFGQEIVWIFSSSPLSSMNSLTPPPLPARTFSWLPLIFPTLTMAAAKVFPPVIPACFSSQTFPARAFITLILPLIRLVPRKTILIPIWSTVPTACSSWNVSAKKTGLSIM